MSNKDETEGWNEDPTGALWEALDDLENLTRTAVALQRLSLAGLQAQVDGTDAWRDEFTRTLHSLGERLGALSREVDALHTVKRVKENPPSMASFGGYGGPFSHMRNFMDTLNHTKETGDNGN